MAFSGYTTYILYKAWAFQGRLTHNLQIDAGYPCGCLSEVHPALVGGSVRGLDVVQNESSREVVTSEEGPPAQGLVVRPMASLVMTVAAGVVSGNTQKKKEKVISVVVYSYTNSHLTVLSAIIFTKFMPGRKTLLPPLLFLDSRQLRQIPQKSIRRYFNFSFLGLAAAMQPASRRP